MVTPRWNEGPDVKQDWAGMWRCQRGESQECAPSQDRVLGPEPQAPALRSAPEPLGGSSSGLHALSPSHGIPETRCIK